MTDYNVLIKDLREPCPHENCVLSQQAADAIEELQGRFHMMKKTAEWLGEQVPRWIPVTERLPGDGDNVIVCTKSGSVGEAKYQAALGYDLDFPDVWFLLNDYGNQYQTEEIIAWMPLPEPPKEE